MLTDAGRQLDALGDPSRRAILDLLREEPAPVGRLAAVLPISRPAVSQHLAVLRRAGLVRDAAQGTRRVYSLDHDGLLRVRALLEDFWRADLDDYAAHVARSQAADAGPGADR